MALQEQSSFTLFMCSSFEHDAQKLGVRCLTPSTYRTYSGAIRGTMAPQQWLRAITRDCYLRGNAKKVCGDVCLLPYNGLHDEAIHGVSRRRTTREVNQHLGK